MGWPTHTTKEANDAWSHRGDEFRLYVIGRPRDLGHFCYCHASPSNLERAYRIVTSKKFEDLTPSFGSNTAVWSGFGQAKMLPAPDPETNVPYTIAKDGFHESLDTILRSGHNQIEVMTQPRPSTS
jgi:hypothetical protein